MSLGFNSSSLVVRTKLALSLGLTSLFLLSLGLTWPSLVRRANISSSVDLFLHVLSLNHLSRPSLFNPVIIFTLQYPRMYLSRPSLFNPVIIFTLQYPRMYLSTTTWSTLSLSPSLRFHYFIFYLLNKDLFHFTVFVLIHLPEVRYK